MPFDPSSVLRDPARLAVLRATGLIESPQAESLHRYTRLIARLVEAPVAILSVVDDRREHVLSAIGLADALTSPREIPLTDSIARLVIGGRAPLTAADIREDPLLATIPVLARLEVVAYAGVPLMVQGQPLGVLAVAQSRRRDWATQDMAALADLGAAAGAELELRISVRSLQAREERVDDLLAYAGDMILTLAPTGRILRANGVLEAALGYAPGALEERYGIELVAPEDRETYLRAAGRIMAEGALADLEVHLLTRAGERRLVRGGASFRYGERVPLGVRLIFRDVTAERDAQEQLALLERVTRGLAAAADVPKAMHVALAEMGRFAGWSYGEAWLRTPDGYAELCQCWAGDAGLEEFGSITRPLRVPTGGRAAGGVWTSGVPTRFDLAQEGENPRSAEAATRLRQGLTIGLGPALAVPIIAGEETLGIFVFAARAGAETREDRTAALATVAAQIGPVVQRRRAEAQVLDVEARLRDLVDSINDLVMTLAPDGRITFANRAAQAALHYGEEDIRTLRLADLLHPDSRDSVLAAMERVLAGASAATIEARLLARDGRVIDVEGSASVRMDGGRPVAIRSYFRDVTERRRAEEELRRTAQMLDLAYDAVVIHTLPDRLVTYWNRGAERLYGWPRAEVVGRSIDALLSSSSPTPAEEIQAAVLRDGRWEGELRRSGRGGATVTVDSRWTLLREGGLPVAVLEISTDITERKRAQQLFGAVIAAATENAIIAGEESSGTILAFNAGAERMLGYRADELVGKATPLVLHDPAELAARAAELGVEPGREALIHEVRLGRAETREWTYIRKDGTRLPVSLTITAMRNEYGEIHGFLGVATDIRERKRIEEALRAARDAAESATRAKSEFLANMSHEIRTPMNAILGMTELLTEMDLAPEQHGYIELVQGAAESLLQVIDDILDFSRIEAGQLVLDPHPFRLRDAFGDTVRMLGVRAREKQLELVYRVQPDVPDALVGDLGRLRQVLVNLVGNAIKFTEQGEVVVEVSAEAEAGDGVRLQLEVRDTGIGISPDRQRAIFEPFTQADASTTRRFGGSGLGLTISRKILSLMGGSIGVESEPGRGSTFRVSVPLRRDPAAVLESTAGVLGDRAAGEREPPRLRSAPTVPAGAPREASLRVLLAEDNLVNQKVARAMLEKHGHVVVVAANGREVVELARRGGFDVVLMDAQMPELSGLEATALIREHERTAGGHLPIIAVTAHALKSDRERCLAAGMDGYLTKPLRARGLLEALAQVLSPARSLPAEPADP